MNSLSCIYVDAMKKKKILIGQFSVRHFKNLIHIFAVSVMTLSVFVRMTDMTSTRTTETFLTFRYPLLKAKLQ